MKISVLDNENPQSIFIRLWDGILCFFLLFGLSFGVLNWTENRGYILTTVIFTFLFSIVMSLFSSNKLKKMLFYITPVAMAGVMLVIWHKNIFNGFVYTHNSVMDLIGQAKGLIVSKLESDIVATTFDITVFRIFVITFFYLAIGISVRFNKIFVPFISVLAVTLFGLYVGKISYISVVLMLLSIIGMLLKKCLKHGNLNDKKLFITRLSILVISLISVVIVIQITGENKNEFLIANHKSIIKAVDKMRYGETILTDGDFSELQDFKPTKQPRLEVVMSNPDSYYLRGFVGEKYHSNGWENLENSKLYENSDLFYWLHKNDFFGHTQMSLLTKLIKTDFDENRVFIKNISASKKYVYSPYELLSDKNNFIDSKKIGDKNIQPKEVFPKDSYTYYCLNNQVKSYTSLGEKLYESEQKHEEKIDDYLNNEAHYNQFVYENYLDIPDENKAVIKNLLGDFDDKESHCDVGVAKEKILSYLTENMVYNISPEHSSGDFVNSFLQETKEGYSVHFATTATLMFRYFGIPARYVEGYIIPPEKIKDKIKNSAIVLDDTNAHAWVEFYQDGVGWIPFEITPEYLDVMEKADDLKGVSQSNSNIKEDKDVSKKDDAKVVEGIDEFSLQDESKNNLVNVFIFLIAVILFGLITVFLVVILHRRNKLKKIYETFDSDNLNLSINNLFAYSCLLIEIVGMTKDSFGEKYVNYFENALDIFNEAMYSNHSVTEDKRSVLLDFERMTVENIKKNRSKLQIFKDKYIKYLYF